jgi:multisubunit Na+/H+ antiporter MnhB subunit
MTSLAPLFDGLLVMLILGLAIWMLVTRTSFQAALGFTAYGLLLALIWVRLASSDVALTEAALGGGLTGLLLLGAAARLPQEGWSAGPDPLIRLLVGLAAALVTLGLALLVVQPSLSVPSPAVPGLTGLVADHLAATGLGNPVNGVLLGFRALDTLAEAVVLVLVLVALWSLTPDRGWGGRPGYPNLPQANAGLLLLAQVLPPFGILVGIHLAWTGANHPGGAFQGAAILAAMWLLTLIAGLTRPPEGRSRGLRWLIILGPLVFIGIGLAGHWLAGAILAFPKDGAKPLILLIEAGLTLSIAIALGLLLGSPSRDPADPGTRP